ncbi:MAG: YncE family protein [Polaromonas sp.]|nr:YncE family protein [Polaromonas sp.]
MALTSVPSPVLAQTRAAIRPGAASSAPSALASSAPVTTSLAAPAAGSITSPVFVLNSLDDSVSVINASNWTETKRIATGKQPHHLYLTPDEKSLIVANALSDSLTFIDPKTAEVQRTVRGIMDPYQLRFSPDMKWFVTAANRLNHIDIYKWDGKDITLVKRVPTGKTPSHLWIDSKSSTVYSTMQDSDELIALDLASQTVKWRTKTGSIPADVYGTSDDKFLLVGLTGGDAVEVYDVSDKASKEPKRVKVIKTGAGAHAFRAFGDGRHVLVSNRVADSISKVDLQTMEVVDKFPAPGGPDCIDVSRDGKQILVTSRWARKLTIIDIATRKIVRQVNVGKSPHGVWTLDHAPR